MKLTLKILGMDCAPCAMMIDEQLEALTGVVSSHTHYGKSQTVVEFDQHKVSQKDLFKAVSKAGYQVAT